MKLKFDAALDYQQEAIAAVRDVFQGQTPKQALFTVAAIANEQMALGFGDDSEQLTLGQGIGNRLMLDEEDLLKERIQQILAHYPDKEKDKDKDKDNGKEKDE